MMDASIPALGLAYKTGVKNIKNVMNTGRIFPISLTTPFIREKMKLSPNVSNTIGIIGPNGAGKTTLLKMMNGIFWPDKGKITVKGKVGALIEVGAGFHPLLTGRENVYINAAILGMTKEEVDKKFDDIVEFADIGDFLDTPVKFYSSGMFVRLGFAVAVHCEPAILLVDEVLAVGDMQFRAKCQRKMKELQSHGSSLVFVSHNLPAIEGVCRNTIFLNKGRIGTIGETKEAIKAYKAYMGEKGEEQGRVEMQGDVYSFKGVKITDVLILNGEREKREVFSPFEKVIIQVYYFTSFKIENPIFNISAWNSAGILCCRDRTIFHNVVIDSIKGTGYFEVEIPGFCLTSGVYTISAAIVDKSKLFHYCYHRDCTFRIDADGSRSIEEEAIFFLQGKWTHVKTNGE